jgi:Glycosyl hydrolases family 16
MTRVAAKVYQRIVLRSLIFAGTLLGCVNPGVGTEPGPVPSHLKGLTLVWSDEFNGSALDTTKWQAVDGVPRQGGSTWMADEVKVKDGYLHLGITATKIPTSNKDKANYNCGAVRTKKDYSKGLFTKTYGYFEARCKLPARIDADYWAAFWMMTGSINDKQPSTQLGNEIDIMESFTIANKGKHHLTMHWNGYGALHNSYSLDCGKPANLKDGNFHVYGFYWDQSKYISYVDGVEVGRTSFVGLGSKDKGKTPSDGPCRKPGYIKLTCEAAQWAGGGGWENPFPEKDVFQVDYVRVYTGTIP